MVQGEIPSLERVRQAVFTINKSGDKTFWHKTVMLICIISMKTPNSIFHSKKHGECFGGSCERSNFLPHVLSHLLSINQELKTTAMPSCASAPVLMGPLILKIIALALTEIRNPVI